MLGLISADNSFNGFLETGVTGDKARAAAEEILEQSPPNALLSQNIPFSRPTKTVMNAAVEVKRLV